MGYNKRTYYWEVIITLRKTFVILVSIFFVQFGVEVQVLAGMLITGVALVLHVHFAPFVLTTKDHDTLHFAELSSLSISVLTLWIGLVLFQENVGNEGIFGQCLTVALIIINTVFLLYAVHILLTLYIIDMTANLDNESVVKTRL